MKTIILEKIFKILNNCGIKTWVDGHDIVIDSDYGRVRFIDENMTWVKGVHTWKSIDDFLFSKKTSFSFGSEKIIGNKFYGQHSIFDLFDQEDSNYVICQYAANLNVNVGITNTKHYVLCHEANKILKQIRGDSLEEIAVKMDLAGI